MKFSALSSLGLAIPLVAGFPLDSPAWVSAVGKRQVEGTGEPLPLPAKPPPFDATAQKISVSGAYAVSATIDCWHNRSSSTGAQALSTVITAAPQGQGHALRSSLLRTALHLITDLL